jgi:hypothetical protein
METKEALEFVSPKDLRGLLERPEKTTVSIYHPTTRVAVEPEENSLHLKNLLREAEDLLVASGTRKPAAAKILEPAVSLLDDDDFWVHQLEGLALFLDDEDMTYFRLPEGVSEVVSVSDVPLVKPMLASVFPTGQFYVLALSQKAVRLLHCSRHLAEELDLSQYDFPRSFEETVQFDVSEGSDPQRLPTSGPGMGTRRQPTGVEDQSRSLPGHGDAAVDRKQRVREHFARVSRTLDSVLGTAHIPLILSAVDWIQSIYRDVSSYRPILKEYIESNPDRLLVQELHKRAKTIFERRRQTEIVAKWKEDFGALQAHGRATTDIKEILFGAHESRISTLFLNQDAGAVWGTYDLRDNAIELNDERRQGDYDLYDLAARQTVLTDGEAMLLPAEDMPIEGAIAAIYRW